MKHLLICTVLLSAAFTTALAQLSFKKAFSVCLEAKEYMVKF